MVSQPKAPDPYATAAAQNSQNAFASQYNSVSSNANEINPYGTVSYQAIEQVPIYTNGVVTGYAPRYQRTSTLSPDQQKLHGLETQSKYNMGTAAVEQSAKLREHLNKGIDPTQWEAWNRGAGGAPTLKNDYRTTQGTMNNYTQANLRQDQGTTDRAGIEKAMMDSYYRNTNTQNKAQEAQLAARGLNVGSAGYGTYQQQRGDNEAEAARQAYLSSGDEARRAQDAYNQAGLAQSGETRAAQDFYNNNLYRQTDDARTADAIYNQQTSDQYNLQQNWGSYANNLRGAQMAEALGLRNQPINEITALLSGSQATVPQFQPFQSSPVQASNIAQYINDNYKAQSQAASQTNAGIFSMIGGLAKMMPMG